VLEVNPADDQAHLPIPAIRVGKSRAGELVHVLHHFGLNLQATNGFAPVPDGLVIAATLDGDHGQKELEGKGHRRK
jgi:hypothetical protein